jgi:hypothetical protein
MPASDDDVFADGFKPYRYHKYPFIRYKALHHGVVPPSPSSFAPIYAYLSGVDSPSSLVTTYSRCASDMLVPRVRGPLFPSPIFCF